MKKTKPWVKYKEMDDNKGQFVMAPLKKGMGLTIGNSLRRVLISSLTGSAVTAIKIEGVEHEFSTLPHIVEDVLDIICNVKGIVFKAQTEEPRCIKLRFSGKGVVRAKDIEKNSEVEVINGDHHIAELTTKGKLNMDLYIEKGIGCSPSESHAREDHDINVMLVDASFSPVVRVNHDVEKIRVGEELDYESLIVDVWTNGSVNPEEVIQAASNSIISHFSLFGELNQKPDSEEEVEAEEEVSANKESALSMSIHDLELSARSINCLKRAGIHTVGELVNRDISELTQIKNFGLKSADGINEKLKVYGLQLKDEQPVLESDGDGS
ncbi:MAG: DNA-directed RNA polymerase subunit alpha [Flavobacteriales bacterium]|nr:DNA-directed RNA polymerase subunit alpha [Flavobacteriales bacterium]